jgi:ATP-dependent DNA ligase
LSALFRCPRRTFGRHAFDLLELDGRHLRREPLEQRKALLARLLRGSRSSIVLNEHYEEDGKIVFREACKLGCEGIGSAHFINSGRSAHWVKVKTQKPRLRKWDGTMHIFECI